MNTARLLTITLLAALLPTLGACSSGQSSSGSIAGLIDHSVAHALDKAQVKLREEPITVSHDDSGLPKAEITPKGDFIVGGKQVDITPAQRAALLDYRKQLVSVAIQGITIGKQGTALGMHAASTAIAGVFSGKSDSEIQKKVEAEASGIRQAAARLCDRMPALMTEQQKLAATLPAFKPYATMTQKDIDDCRTNALKDGGDDSD